MTSGTTSVAPARFSSSRCASSAARTTTGRSGRRLRTTPSVFIAEGTSG
jgi:hypothetical protein